MTDFALLAALAPTLLWLLVLWRRDYREREPLAVLLLLFVVGIATAFLLQTSGNWLLQWLPLDPVWRTLALAATEEICKAMGLLLAFSLGLRRQFDQIIDPMIYAAVLALGFAAWENYQYFTQIDGDLALIVLRSTVTALAHASFGAVVGWALGQALFTPHVCHSLPLRLRWWKLLAWRGWWSCRLHIVLSHLLPQRLSRKGHGLVDVVREGLLLAIVLHALFNLLQLWYFAGGGVLLVGFLVLIIWHLLVRGSLTQLVR